MSICAYLPPPPQVRGIDTVLTVSKDLEPPQFEGINYVRIAVDDVDEEDLKTHFATAQNIIHECVSSGRSILVHCYQGVSRSATCVVCYQMRQTGMTAAEALADIHSRRHAVNPNKGFRRQLLEYEADIARESIAPLQ